jgi:S1-C subfamily serine protease
MMENDAPIEPGSSGSAVIDDDGDVVGMAYAASTSGERNFAVPVSVLHKILNNPNHTRYNPGCDAGIPGDGEYKECSDSVSAGSATSCPFALAVERAWVASDRQDGVVMATSPVTHKTYEMRCRAGTHLATCSGGDGAVVIIALR